MNNIKSLLDAAAFAARKHTGQVRKGEDGQPYINHPLEVANLLASVGEIEDLDVLIAAILHDTIEDTDTTAYELRERFGETTAGYVLEVTDDKSLPKQERKQLQIEHAPHLSNGAKLVKLADKISNIRDVTENPPADWDVDRKREYIKWGQKVVAGLRGVNEPLEKAFDELVNTAANSLR